jgi:hypothetical protein
MSGLYRFGPPEVKIPTHLCSLSKSPATPPSPEPAALLAPYRHSPPTAAPSSPTMRDKPGRPGSREPRGQGSAVGEPGPVSPQATPSLLFAPRRGPNAPRSVFATNGSHPDGPRAPKISKIGWRNAPKPLRNGREGRGQERLREAGCGATYKKFHKPEVTHGLTAIF